MTLRVVLFPTSLSRVPNPLSRRPRPGNFLSERSRHRRSRTTTMAAESVKVVDSHLHVWASAEEAANGFPYHPGYEPTIPGNVEFLLESMGEAGVDGAVIVQPINHMFDHSLVTSVLKRYPSKFIGCCLANPAADGTGIKQFEELILQDGYRAVRLNPNLWPSGQKMTNDVGKTIFSKAGILGVPVCFLCTKGLDFHISEIEELCSEFPSTIVLIDHLGFAKPSINDEDNGNLSALLKLSRFPQVYVKFSALFRLSGKPFPYEDLSEILSQLVSRYGANRILWGSDFPYVVPECGYKEAKEAVTHVANLVPLSPSDLEWIIGKTAIELFKASWDI